MKFAVVGCGRQAPKHISGLVANGIDDIVVADLDPRRAADLAAVQPVRAADSVEEIFDDPAIAAISICTPPVSHGGLIRRAIATGKHFICEKPLSASLAEARDLEAETRRAGLVGMVGYIYRFAPAFELGARVLSGASTGGEAAGLGKISSAFFRLGGPGSHEAWQHRRETDGGATNEMLVHMADLAIWYFGPMRSAQLLASEIRTPEREIAGEVVRADAEDWVLARFVSHGGVEILIEADLATPTFIQYAEVHGTNGSFMGSIQHDMPTFVHCLESRAGFAAGRTAHPAPPRNLYEAQMGFFADCVAGRRTPGKCTLTDSVLLLEAVERLQRGDEENIGK